MLVGRLQQSVETIKRLETEIQSKPVSSPKVQAQ